MAGNGGSPFGMAAGGRGSQTNVSPLSASISQGPQGSPSGFAAAGSGGSQAQPGAGFAGTQGSGGAGGAQGAGGPGFAAAAGGFGTSAGGGGGNGFSVMANGVSNVATLGQGQGGSNMAAGGMGAQNSGPASPFALAGTLGGSGGFAGTPFSGIGSSAFANFAQTPFGSFAGSSSTNRNTGSGNFATNFGNAAGQGYNFGPLFSVLQPQGQGQISGFQVQERSAALARVLGQADLSAVLSVSPQHAQVAQTPLRRYGVTAPPFEDDNFIEGSVFVDDVLNNRTDDAGTEAAGNGTAGLGALLGRLCAGFDSITYLQHALSTNSYSTDISADGLVRFCSTVLSSKLTSA